MFCLIDDWPFGQRLNLRSGTDGRSVKSLVGGSITSGSGSMTSGIALDWRDRSIARSSRAAKSSATVFFVKRVAIVFGL